MDASKIADLILRIGGSKMDIRISRDELRKRITDLAIEGMRTGSTSVKAIREKFADTLLTKDQLDDVVRTLKDVGIKVEDEIDLLSKYVDRMHDRQLLPTTIQVALYELKRFQSFMAAKYRVNVFSEDIKNARGYMVSSFDDEKRERGLKESSRIDSINVIRPYLHWAFSQEYTDRDLGEALPRIKLRNFDPEHLLDEGNGNEDKVYSGEDIKRMIQIALQDKNKERGLRNAALIAFLAGTGLRSTEAITIPYGQIHNMKDDGIIIVRRKGGKYAKVAVAKFAIPYLRAYDEVRGTANDADPFFVSVRGAAMDRRGLYNALSPIQQALGLRTGIHNFRYTVVTNVSRRNDSGVAAMIAGHTSDAVTRKHYILPSDQDKIEVINDLSYADELSMEEEPEFNFDDLFSDDLSDIDDYE